MSAGNSGLFKGTAGARADEADAPIGFDETPPEESGSAFHCRDHAPRTICPTMTNGERLRAMDNHQLAEWLEDFSWCPAVRYTDDILKWLGQPCKGETPDTLVPDMRD